MCPEGFDNPSCPAEEERAREREREREREKGSASTMPPTVGELRGREGERERFCTIQSRQLRATWRSVTFLGVSSRCCAHRQSSNRLAKVLGNHLQ